MNATCNNLCVEIIKQLPSEYWSPCIKLVEEYTREHPQATEEQVIQALILGREAVERPY